MAARSDLVVISIPGRDDDPALYFVADRIERKQIAGPFPTPEGAGAALRQARQAERLRELLERAASVIRESEHADEHGEILAELETAARELEARS